MGRGVRRVRCNGSVVWGVLVLGGVLLVLATTSWALARSNVVHIERFLHQLSMGAAADSAFEEVCARLEGQLTPVPPSSGTRRDLGRLLGWPERLDAVETSNRLSGSGITVGPVSVKSSKWSYNQYDAEAGVADGTQLVLEMGILELSVVLNSTRSRPRLQRTVTVRRFVSLRPGSRGLRLIIQSQNLSRDERGPA